MRSFALQKLRALWLLTREEPRSFQKRETPRYPLLDKAYGREILP